jgi:hypothetical protein
MVTRRQEVAAAVESQPPGSTVLVSDGSKLLASRDGHGDSAVLLMLDPDLVDRIMDGEPYNVRPEMTPKIQAALRKKAKADRARNRKAKRKQAAAKSADGPNLASAGTRGLSGRPVIPEPVREPEPPAEPMPSRTSDRLRVI